MATTGPVDVYVDTGELGRLRSELEALGQALVEEPLRGVDHDAAGGWDVGSTIDDFCGASWKARNDLVRQLARASGMVAFAIEHYEATEHHLRDRSTGVRT